MPNPSPGTHVLITDTARTAIQNIGALPPDQALRTIDLLEIQLRHLKTQATLTAACTTTKDTSNA